MPTKGVSPSESVRRRSSLRSSLRACARSCQCLASTWRSSGHIAKAAEARSLVVGFRLAPEHPYPAQVDDAETAYRWLLSHGYEPQNIGSTGQSIAGTLAVMLPLRLLANGEPTPGAIVSISPGADLTIQNPAVDENEKTDKMLSRNSLERFRGYWLQDPALEFTDPQISLTNADLTGLPPTSVYYCEYETLVGEGAELGRRLADFKVTSEVHPMPEGQHMFILSAGRVPETDQPIGRIGQWLRRHLGALAEEPPPPSAGFVLTPPGARRRKGRLKTDCAEGAQRPPSQRSFGSERGGLLVAGLLTPL